MLRVDRRAVVREGAERGGGVVEVGEELARREATSGQGERVLDESGAGLPEGQEEGELLEDLRDGVVEVGVEGAAPQVDEGVGAGERRLEECGDVAEAQLDLRADRAAEIRVRAVSLGV